MAAATRLCATRALSALSRAFGIGVHYSLFCGLLAALAGLAFLAVALAVVPLHRRLAVTRA